VNLGSKADNAYSIDGAVELTGLQPLVEEMTVLEAVQRARPIVGTADLSRVQLTRTSFEVPLILTIDVQRMLDTGETTSNVLLRVGDSVLVPALE